MRYSVLGDVRVHLDAPVELNAAKERRLLAALLVHRNRPASADDPLCALWGEDPPRTATKTLQTYVLHLRRVLGDRIRTTPTGYQLDVEDGELDLDDFEARAREGRLAFLRGDAGHAARALGEALSLWRG